jgi:hypothetical protein
VSASNARPARRSKLTASDENIRVGGPDPEPEPDPKAEPKNEPGPDPQQDPGPADPPPNGGVQVPPQEGTQVGTSPGTQVGRKEEEAQEEGKEDSLDFSLRGALADKKDPEQDWVKSGWQALRYRKAAVDVAIKFKWRGFTERQEVVDAALAAYLPKELMDAAREMARKGEL